MWLQSLDYLRPLGQLRNMDPFFHRFFNERVVEPLPCKMYIFFRMCAKVGLSYEKTHPNKPIQVIGKVQFRGLLSPCIFIMIGVHLLLIAFNPYLRNINPIWLLAVQDPIFSLSNFLCFFFGAKASLLQGQKSWFGHPRCINQRVPGVSFSEGVGGLMQHMVVCIYSYFYIVYIYI